MANAVHFAVLALVSMFCRLGTPLLGFCCLTPLCQVLPACQHWLKAVVPAQGSPAVPRLSHLSGSATGWLCHLAVQHGTLTMLHPTCREATTSMTSVPKPLKFLRAHYEGLKTQYSSLPASNANRPALADVLSVLAITSGKEGERESLHYRWALSG